MSDVGQQGHTSQMSIDGIALGALQGEASLVRTDATGDLHRFWASGARPIHSKAKEIMEVSFGSARLLNHLSFKVGRFPLHMSAEWYDDQSGKWNPLTYAIDPAPVDLPTRQTRKRESVRLSISDSSPAIIKDLQKAGHPQQRGTSHWVAESWRTAPVRTSKVRLVFQRNSTGVGPVDIFRRPLNYSVSVRDLTFGYRVLSRYDMPMSDKGVWAASGDILGSRVGYSNYDQPPERLVDGDTSTYWRSEPQPFGFSVVNMHLDMRDEAGDPQVVDRFWIDPITPGVLCNVYYSNDTIHDRFRGLSTPIKTAHETRYGTPVLLSPGADTAPLAIELGPGGGKTGTSVSSVSTRMAYESPWWFGLDAETLAPAVDSASRPIAAMGGTRIIQDGGAIKVITQAGEVISLPLDPSLHQMRTRFALTVSHTPSTGGTTRSSIRIAYRILNHQPVVVEQDLIQPLPPSAAPIGIGLHPDTGNTDPPALSIRGAVVKAEILTGDAEDWFFDEGGRFVSDPATLYDDRGAHFNALVRMHPDFVTETNPFGVVGGANDPFDQMVWTPVRGDFALKQGYLHVPPTKAAFWKFEMTGLLPEVYENFLTMDRDVLVFPHDVVAPYEAVAGGLDSNSAPHGVRSTENMAPTVTYSDVRDAIDRSQTGINFEQDAEATKVLVVRDPVQAQQVATSGWVWSYQPWHSGSRAPRFSSEQVHRYDRLRIRHSTKVAYFAGIREIEPHRVDYNFPDDTPEYVEHFLDESFIELDLEETSGIVFDSSGGVRSQTSTGRITSKALRSFRNVRGVQFATQESDLIQVLEDPDFNANNMIRWTPYGDANLSRVGPSMVVVSRGWNPNTYGELEQNYDDYANMESDSYAELEGLTPVGLAAGGVSSQDHTPYGSGEVMVRAHVSAPVDLSSPVVVEIVSSETGVVLASSSRLLKAGESIIISARATGPGVMESRTWGEIETMVSPPTQYEEMEDYSYSELESTEGAASSIYARVVQYGTTNDVFRVHRIGLYDSPIAWFFSNDDGASWWQAVSVRNDPHSVLTFPEFFDTEDPDMGRTLRWRAQTYKSGVSITALHIRPWYGVRGRTIDRAHGMEILGPNLNLRDLYPATHQHPMWRESFNPIEHVYVPIPPTWRNLVTNPSAEGPADGTEWSPVGGSIAPALGAIGSGIRSFEFTAGGS